MTKKIQEVKIGDAIENNKTTVNRLLAAGDKVNHPLFGNGEIFEISQMLGFADVNLDEGYTDKSGRKRDTVIVSISELVACREVIDSKINQLLIQDY
jgi:hypothetical protein